MPVAHSGIIWRRIFVVLLAATTFSYIWYSRREFPHGGSRWGLAYGVAGSALILLLTFYGIRKRRYRSRFGTVEQWLQSHIYLGLLSFVVLLFHTGGRFNDKIAVATLLLVAVVVVSGLFGAILYVTIPRLLTEVESNLTTAELSEQMHQLARQMARVASGKSVAFQRIHEELIRETTPGLFAGWRLLISRGRRRGGPETSNWAGLLSLVAKEEQDELRQMLVLSRQRKELLLRLIFQQRYRNILESWLYVHVPFTLALLVFAAVHIAAVFYYGSVKW